jgi:hypothetical protein
MNISPSKLRRVARRCFRFEAKANIKKATPNKKIKIKIFRIYLLAFIV